MLLVSHDHHHLAFIVQCLNSIHVVPRSEHFFTCRNLLLLRHFLNRGLRTAVRPPVIPLLPVLERSLGHALAMQHKRAANRVDCLGYPVLLMPFVGCVRWQLAHFCGDTCSTAKRRL